jgi:heterogeneous nuclear ribonucleoprotein R
LGLLNGDQVLEVLMTKAVADKESDHSHCPRGGPNYPLPPYGGGGGYMADLYGSYGGGAHCKDLECV